MAPPPPLIVLSYDFVRNHQYCHLLAPESAHRRERKLAGARVCRVTFNHLPCPPKNVIVRGVGGVPEFLVRLES